MNIYVLKNLWRYTYSRLPYIPSQNTWKRVQIKVSDLKFGDDVCAEIGKDSFITVSDWYDQRKQPPPGLVCNECADRVPDWGLYVVVGYDQTDPKYGYIIVPRIRQTQGSTIDVELGESHPEDGYPIEDDKASRRCMCNSTSSYLDYSVCSCGVREKRENRIRNSFVKSKSGIYPVYHAPILSKGYIYRIVTGKSELAHLDVNLS